MALIENLKNAIDPTTTQKNFVGSSGVTKDYNQLPDQLLSNALNHIVMPLASVVAVVSIIYGGYLYITAGADPEKANKGKRVIIYSVIAIIILVLSYIIYNTVLNCVVPGSGMATSVCPGP